MIIIGFIGIVKNKLPKYRNGVGFADNINYYLAFYAMVIVGCVYLLIRFYRENWWFPKWDFMSDIIIGIGILMVLLVYLIIKGRSNAKNQDSSNSKNRMFYFRALIIVSVGIILLLLKIIK